MMKNLAIPILLLLCAACTEREFTLCNGDLLFQVGADSPMRDAIREATAEGHAVPFTHAAVVEVTDGRVSVIEATGDGGVRRTTLPEFLGRSAEIDGHPVAAVFRLRNYAATETEIAAAVQRAAGFIGQPYDYSFLPDNGRMYCSELLYESYRRDDGTPIFTARPMNFRAADGSMPDFWVGLFARLGEEIPEGIPGTNPADMAAEDCLIKVFDYSAEE